MSECCANCKFSHRFKTTVKYTDFTNVKGYREGEIEHFECRRYPPIFATNGENGDVYSECSDRWIDEDGWCGEWREKLNER